MNEPNEIAKFRLEFTQSLEAMFTKKMVLDHTGKCEFWLESNAVRPEVPEIGYYVTHVAASEADGLRNLARTLCKEQLPPSGPMLSGAPLVDIFLEENGRVTTKSLDPYTPSHSWQEINRRLPQLEKEALKAVRAGLRAECGFAADAVNRSEPIEVIVRLTGVGVENIAFYNPAAPADNAGGSVMLMAVRSDIPESKLGVIHRKFCDLSADKLRSAPPWGHEHHKLLLQLKPKATLVLRFETVLDWPPGDYQVRINMTSNGPQPADEKPIFVRGRIVTPAAPLTVTGESKPQDEGAAHYEPPRF